MIKEVEGRDNHIISSQGDMDEGPGGSLGSWECEGGGGGRGQGDVGGRCLI